MWEDEPTARAVNETNWQPIPGMVKRRCSRCRYWFAVLVAEADTTARCPDCVGFGTRPARKGGG